MSATYAGIAASPYAHVWYALERTSYEHEENTDPVSAHGST